MEQAKQNRTIHKLIKPTYTVNTLNSFKIGLLNSKVWTSFSDKSSDFGFKFVNGANLSIMLGVLFAEYDF